MNLGILQSMSLQKVCSFQTADFWDFAGPFNYLKLCVSWIRSCDFKDVSYAPDKSFRIVPTKQEIEKILIENGEILFKTVSCGCIADPAVLFDFSIVVHPLALNRLETYL